jgi:beta-glucosidase
MNSHSLYVLLGALLAVAAGTVRAAMPADIEQKIDALVARMTLEEKLGQMSQTTFPAKLDDKAREEIRKGRWGSFFNGGTPAEKAEAQRIALKESRLGIPLIYGQDVIHGYETVFPIPLGQAASWDPELIRQAARIAAREASGVGIHWTFAPMMDIARDPRWGRIAESLGEDPYLSGVLAAAMIHGFQGDAPDAPGSIAACAKHFVGYGAAEGGSDYNSTWIPEVLLRNVYLRPFHAAREAGVASFMTAFNDLNGVPASGNEFTVRQVLRNEWKFDGLVVSDYTSIDELIAHGFAADAADAALKGVRAGVDMEMVSTHYYDQVKSLIDRGKLDPELVDESVKNILRVKYRLGLFDRQPTAPAPAAMLAPDALEISRKLAAESLVLLKNDGALPLAKTVGRVAAIGRLADSPEDQVGTWAMNVNLNGVQTPLAALRSVLGKDRVLSAAGPGIGPALEAARGADAVLLFLGEPASLSGEASSRAFLDLPDGQEQLVAEIAKLGKPTIAVIMAGRALTFHDTAAKVNAVLYAWHPGTMGGPAIVDAIFGDAVPSGRLAATFPRTVGQVPLYYNHMSTGRPPSESNKFTSKYLDAPWTPEYPFGFGLSYTGFEYTNLKVGAPQVRLGGKLAISADVANTGKYEADEVVQLYTRQLAASITRPVRELKAFRRIRLKPGEKRTVEFALTTADLSFYNQRGQLAAEPGKFEVWVAPDSASGLKGSFELLR